MTGLLFAPHLILQPTDCLAIHTHRPVAVVSHTNFTTQSFLQLLLQNNTILMTGNFLFHSFVVFLEEVF